MISGWPETGLLPRRRVTVRRFWKKPGLLGILTADVGGCTLMDADEFSFVLDTWVRRYRAKRWEKTRFMKVLNRRFSC